MDLRVSCPAFCCVTKTVWMNVECFLCPNNTAAIRFMAQILNQTHDLNLEVLADFSNTCFK